MCFFPQITMEKTYSDENQVLIRLNLSNFVEMVHAFCAVSLIQELYLPWQPNKVLII